MKKAMGFILDNMDDIEVTAITDVGTIPVNSSAPTTAGQAYTLDLSTVFTDGQGRAMTYAYQNGKISGFSMG